MLTFAETGDLFPDLDCCFYAGFSRGWGGEWGAVGGVGDKRPLTCPVHRMAGVAALSPTVVISGEWY